MTVNPWFSRQEAAKHLQDIRTDGVLVVLEHKGKHLRAGPDGQNKVELVNRVGLTWAKLTELTPTPCRFVMTEGRNWQVIDRVLRE